MTDAAAGSTAICILGMSRTGSSLTARVLNLLGVYLGPEEELLGGELRHLAGEGETVIARAREANPEGFWEHYRIMRLNERILRRLGGNWREPPALEPGWEASEELAAERDEARALLAESFGGRRLWGWKDPRNSLTLPFWQRLLTDVRYVICLRNPVDVSRSLERRDGMSFEKALDLWHTYVARALVNTSGCPRIFVPYTGFFVDPVGTASRLARFVGREGALDAPGTRNELLDAIDERLWRNRTLPRDVVSESRLGSDSAALYLLTEMLGGAELDAPGSRYDGGFATEGDLGVESAVDLYAERLLDRVGEG